MFISIFKQLLLDFLSSDHCYDWSFEGEILLEHNAANIQTNEKSIS